MRVHGPEATSALAAVFPDYRSTAPHAGADGPAESSPDLELCRNNDGSWTLHSFGSPDPTPEGLDLASTFGRMERHLADLLALGNRPALLLHAGGAVVAGRGILVAGPSGSGKSSVSAALAVAGYPVWGDDAVIVSPGGEAHPFKRLFKLHSGALEALRLEPSSGALSALFPDSSFFHPRALGVSWAPPRRLEQVVFVRRDGGPAHRTSMSAAEGIRGLLDLVLGPADRAASLSALVEAVQGVSFSSLTFDRCDLAAGELVRGLS